MIIKSLEDLFNFKPKFAVVGCYLFYGKLVLMLKRHPLKPYGGLWCVPGGKMDSGESIIQALNRELAEETGIVLPADISSRMYCLGPRFVRYPDYDFLYFTFSAEWPKDQESPLPLLNQREHTEWRWLPVADALKRSDLVPDEAECLQEVWQRRLLS
ncbi:MAG: NUDIX hydrolase [Patescibacteria group bacterium]|jgi:8-oxo-dGTP diphosphatase